MSPAEKVIKAYGGEQAVAEALGRHVSRIHRWRYPKERGGTGGSIPGNLVGKILSDAKARGLRLRAADLIQTDDAKAA